MVVCPKCKGRKYIEYEYGLICARCRYCNGTGQIDVGNDTEGNDTKGTEQAPSKPTINTKRGKKKRNANKA